MNITLKTIFVSVLLFIQLLAFGQEPFLNLPLIEEQCGTVQMHKWKQQHFSNVGTDAQFEEWMSRKILENNTESRGGVMVIPIVVHVIHNGEPLGTYPNISDAQIISQINVLNQDFRRISGSNGYNNHPDGADIEMEFCLATIDPQGNPTNGINRQDLNTNSWTMSTADATMKPNTIWDPNQYFNVWVCSLSSGLLGYAQFPVSSGLEGLNGANEASTDGIVIGAEYFGTEDENDGSFILDNTYNLGRTVTHEAGHFFGLRHIWGDGGCGASDYCNDTPDSANSNGGCPEGTVSCATVDMIENYMDYTYDACMNIFTNDQKTRMQTVMANSPRRMSLLNSIVCSPPPSFAFTGQIIDAVTGLGIEGAKVKFEGVFSPESTTGNNGIFSISNLYEGNYEVLAGNWGYVTKAVSNQYFDVNTGNLIIELESGYYDDFALDFEWQVDGDASSGEWTKAVPIGSTYNDLFFDPNSDVDNDFGEQCFLTGNSGGNAGVDDVDNGAINLVSPIFDATIFNDAHLSFYRWFAIGGGQGAIPDDKLEISISNGSQEVILRTIDGDDANLHEWVFEEFTLSDYITVTSSMRLFISVSDQVSSSEGHLVDAAIDLFRIQEGSSVAVDETLAETIGFSLSPNPTSGILNIQMDYLSSNAQIHIFDAIGREVYSLGVTNRNTIVDLSEQASGIYFLQMNVDGNSFVKKIILN